MTTPDPAPELEMTITVKGDSAKVIAAIAREDKIEPGEVLRRALALLQAAREIRIAGGTLNLMDADGEVRGRFEGF